MPQLPPLLVLVAAASALSTVAGLLLDRRQARAVRAQVGQVPAAFADIVAPEAQDKSVRYALARLRADAVSAVVGLTTLLVALFWGFDMVAGAVAGVIPSGLERSVVVLGVLWLASTLVGLPLRAWRSLVIEQRFGFNRQTPLLFLRDVAVAALVSAGLGGPLLALLLWVMQRHRPGWWVAAWLVLTLVMLAAPTIHVRLVAPLFNKFSPLRPELSTRIEALLSRCGFRPAGLFEMDASRRSSRGNAFFSGFGPSKRIVLFDTLIEAHAPEEIEAVVAHELGHFHHRHVLTAILRGILFLFGLCAAVGWLSQQAWLLPGFGIRHQDPALSLVLSLLLAGILSPLLGLLGNAISRRHEFQADRFARDKVGAAPMVAALLRLARDNASTLVPDSVYSFVHHTHPSVPVRVARLLDAGGMPGGRA